MFKKRLTYLYLALALGALGVVSRLAQVQLVDGDRYRRIASRPDRRDVVLPAVRGALLDRDGRLLVRDREGYTVLLFPGVFRERSLLHCIADAWRLLHGGPVSGSGSSDGASLDPLSHERLRARAVLQPMAMARELLALPAARTAVEKDELGRRGGALTAPRGSLLRGRREMTLRLRQCLHALRGDGVRFSHRDLERLREHRGSLGEALEVDAADLGRRLKRETEMLLDLAREVGIEDWSALDEQLDALVTREIDWVENRLARQLEDAICLERFGTAEVGPQQLEAESWLEMVRTAELPLEDPAVAVRAVVNASALLGGGIAPRLAAGDSLRWRGEGDVRAVAAEAGLFAADPEAVKRAYCARLAARDDFERGAYLSPRRVRRLRHQFARSRPWRFGRGGASSVAMMIEGPGKLADLGFRLEPAFVRERIGETVPPDLRLLLGRVSPSRQPVSGVEARLDEHLRGEDGLAKVGADGEEVVARPPQHGESLELTLSLPLQNALQGLLPANGAIAVLDAKTGGILALVTSPSPEDEDLEAAEKERYAIETERQRLVRQKPEGWRGPFRELGERLAVSAAFHRAVENPGHCPPGSVFKAVTLLAAVESGAVPGDCSVFCAKTHKRYFNCKGHGDVGIVRALEVSCNQLCYDAGRALGSEKLVAYFRRLGLFDPVPGLLPADSRLERRLRRNDVRNLAIGQGDIRCPPVRAAGIAASLGAGRTVRPHLYRPEGFEPLGPSLGPAAEVARIRLGMKRVVGPGGTARRTQGLMKLRVAAKTGTAQLTNDAHDTLYQAWFVGYAPAEAPRFAFAVLLDRTSKEGADAAPTAQQMLTVCGDLFGRWW